MVESERGQERMTKVSALAPIAEEMGVKLSNLAIAWCLLNENVSTVILGASKVEQLEENLKSLEVLPLINQEVINKLSSI
jgi:aryl-alcohol dehydrogenase-like predicted oxidoreductase